MIKIKGVWCFVHEDPQVVVSAKPAKMRNCATESVPHPDVLEPPDGTARTSALGPTGEAWRQVRPRRTMTMLAKARRRRTAAMPACCRRRGSRCGCREPATTVAISFTVCEVAGPVCGQKDPVIGRAGRHPRCRLQISIRTRQVTRVVRPGCSENREAGGAEQGYCAADRSSKARRGTRGRRPAASTPS